MNSRDRVLARVRRAIGDASDSASSSYAQDVPRDYHEQHGARTAAETADLLAENLAEYRALVHRAQEADLPALIARLLAERDADSVLAPAGLPREWLSAVAARLVEDSPDSTPHELDEVAAVVTGCALAVAETGTLVLDGSPDQGRRRITLIPDHHICVVRVPEQLVSSVPQALPRLDPGRPLTWISGPSATSDIELDRVEGVHGPRTLQVILVE